MLGSLKKIYHLLSKSDRYKLVGLFCLMIFTSVLEMAGLGAIPAFVYTLSDPDKVLSYPLVSDFFKTLNITTQKELMLFGVIALIILYVVKNVVIGFVHYMKAKFVNNRRVKFGVRLFRSYMHAPYTFHLENNTSRLLRNINGEVNLLVNIMLNFLTILMDALLIISVFIMLLYVEPMISIISILALGLTSLLFLQLVRSKIKEYGKEQQFHRNEMIKAVNQGLGGVKDAKILRREKYFIDVFKHSADRNAYTNRYKVVAKSLPKNFIETIAVVGMLIICVLFVYQGREVAQILPTLALFGVAVARLLPAFKDMVSNFTNIRFDLYAVDPVYDDLQFLEHNYTNERNADRANKNKRVQFENQIRIRDLHYNYPNSDEQALDGINIDISKGSAVAFVGPSGAGKTTIVDAILGLLEPTGGQILADDYDISQNIRGWQKNVGYIPQSIYLSDESIKKNIAYGIPEDEISEKQLWQSIEAAQLKDMIESLSDGVDTVIGERGVMLSGGQQQRIGIARALYHNPEVLIMDEATSALDNITEQFVIEAIERLRGERTIIMIAHRLSTVRNCDNIFYMEEGKVISEGKYDELLENSESFQRMAV